MAAGQYGGSGLQRVLAVKVLLEGSTCACRQLPAGIAMMESELRQGSNCFGPCWVHSLGWHHGHLVSRE